MDRHHVSPSHLRTVAARTQSVLRDDAFVSVFKMNSASFVALSELVLRTLLTSSKPPTRREEDKEGMLYINVYYTFNKSDNPLSVESYQFQEFQTSETARKVSPVSSPLGASSVVQPSQFRDTWRVKSDTVLPDVKTIEGVLCRRGMA